MLLQDDLQSRLIPGERVIWTGAPPPGFLLSGRDLMLVPFSLIWAGFIVFWAREFLSRASMPSPLMLFLAVFVLFGLYAVVGRFFLDAWLRANTA